MVYIKSCVCIWHICARANPERDMIGVTYRVMLRARLIWWNACSTASGTHTYFAACVMNFGHGQTQLTATCEDETSNPLIPARHRCCKMGARSICAAFGDLSRWDLWRGPGCAERFSQTRTRTTCVGACVLACAVSVNVRMPTRRRCGGVDATH